MFLNTSIQALGKNLMASGEDKFKIIRQEFPEMTMEQFKLLMGKQVYPDDYMDTWEKFEEQQLPTKELFFNKLRDKDITDEDYAHAQEVWRKCGCETMMDYHDLYLMCDVLTLCAAFEEFRTVCLKSPRKEVDPATRFSGQLQLLVVEPGNYELDPAHYVSAPHLSWDAMLKCTGCKLELITDPTMYQLLQNNMRGGVCMISQRYARANNKYLGNSYDPQKETTYIVDIDANNLYGKAMSFPLPFSGFEWLLPEQWAQINWLEQLEKQDIGYFVTWDLEYPADLHEEHNDYPMGPERIEITANFLSPKQVEIARHYSRGRGQKSVKLLPSLMTKKNYCVHYLNLQFYIRHGLKLVKIHNVIRFKQSSWLAPYIEKNQHLRASAQNELEKDFFKLMNNAVYGKTCENLSKRTDIRLVTDRKEAMDLASKPHCINARDFGEQMVGIELLKVNQIINKPFYVGFAVLELSKLHMMRYPYLHFVLLIFWFDSIIVNPHHGPYAHLVGTLLSMGIFY